MVGLSVVAEVLDDELVRVGDRVGDASGERSRIALVPVRAGMREYNGRSARVVHDLRAPDRLVESLHTAVEVIGAVVERQVVRLPVDHNPPAGDPVAISADHGSEVAGLRQVAIQVLVTDHDVVEAPLPVRHLDRHEDDPVGDCPDFHPGGVGQGKELDGGAVGHHTKRRLRYFRCNWHKGSPGHDRVDDATNACEGQRVHEETETGMPCDHPGLGGHRAAAVSATRLA